MAEQATLAVAVLLVATVVAVGLAAVAYRNREIPAAGWFAAVMLSVCLWAGAYALQIHTTDLVWTRRWHTLKYLGVVTLPLAWLGFTLSYRSDDTVFRRYLPVIAVVPTLSVLLIVTNASHGLFWATRVADRSIAGLTVVAGPAFWLHTVHSYLLLTVGTLALLWGVFRARNLYRGQIVILLVAVGLPWLSNAAFILGVQPVPSLDPTPIAFALTGVLLAFAIHSYRLLDLAPVAWELARDVALEDMNDGAIALDVRHRVIDLNSTATHIVGRPRAEVVGRHIETVLPCCRQPLGRDDEHGSVETLVDGEWRYFELQCSTVRAFGDRSVGKLLTLHDVTDRQLREQRLNVQNRVLRHNLRNDLNVVTGYLDLLEPSLDDQHQRDILRCARRKSEQLVRQSEKSRRLGTALDRPVQLRRLDLVPAVTRVVEHCRVEFPHVDIAVTVPATVCVVADDSLGAVVTELVENAALHSGDGCHVRLSVRPGDETVELRVEDDGPGIPDHELAALTSGWETALEHGTGLGLWLVTWATTRYGGTFRAERNSPRGTVAVLELQRAREGDDEPTPPAQNSASTPRNTA